MDDKMKAAFEAVTENEKAVLAEARTLAQNYFDAMGDLADRLGYGIIQATPALDVVHSARQGAEATLAAIGSVEAEYPKPADPVLAPPAPPVEE